MVSITPLIYIYELLILCKCIDNIQLIVTVKNTFAIEWEESYLSLQSTNDSIVGEDGGTTTQVGGRAFASSLARKACGDMTGVER